MKLLDLTPTQLLTRELIESADLMKYTRTLLRRRLAQIGKVQKNTLATDATQAKISEELVNIINSMSGTVDKVSKGLLRPQGLPEAPVDTDAIMDEIMKGSKK